MDSSNESGEKRSILEYTQFTSRLRIPDIRYIPISALRGDNVVAALTVCAPLLNGFGGHPRAAGLQLKPGALDDFRRDFCVACAAQRGNSGDTRPELLVDGWLT